MKYIVEVREKPTKEELKFAMRFTVLARAKGRCENCSGQVRLDIAHKLPQQDYPDLVYEPSNALALCRSCHLKRDHVNHHRPSGRPVGYHHNDETKKRISESNKVAKNTPKGRARQMTGSLKTAAKRQRKTKPRNCEYCGQPLPKPGEYNPKKRFCSAACGYRFRTGKPRAGW